VWGTLGFLDFQEWSSIKKMVLKSYKYVARQYPSVLDRGLTSICIWRDGDLLTNTMVGRVE
jgi:hypothetical protein